MKEGIEVVYEKNVITAVLTHPELFAEALEILKSDDFYDQTCRFIFNECENLYNEHGKVIIEELLARCYNKVDVSDEILNVLDGSLDNIDFLMSCRKVKELSKKRQLLGINRELEKILTGKVEIETNEIERLYQQMLDRAVSEEVNITDDVLEQVLDVVTERKRAREVGKSLIEIDTGYRSINNYTNGFRKGDLIIIAARPGMGKTAFMLNQALQQLKNDHTVMIFSLEMSKEQLYERMISILSNVDMQKIRKGNISDEEYEEIVEAIDYLDSLQKKLIIVDKSGMTINEIRTEIRQKQKRYNIDIVYVDYLQLINSVSQYKNKNVEIGEVSRIAKIMARELNIAVVMLAQLSREVEKRTNKRPVLSDLRDSGEIEQNADIVFFLYRKEYYDDIGQSEGIESICEDVEVIIAKHRNGPVGVVKLLLSKDTLRFFEYEKEE